MELTKEQVQRINDFLEGIGIEYIDIRFEMVDHIASEIENKIDDIHVFFGNKGFQTPFIKFMLSRKKALVTRYKKQVKKLNWHFTKTILLDVLKISIQPKNILFILLTSFFCIWFGPKYTREISILLFSSLFISIFYTSYITYGFMKKFDKIKIVKTYSLISSLLVIIPLNFPNFIDVFYNGNHELKEVYIYLISFVLSYLVQQSFLNKKRIIELKYKYLFQ